MTWPAGNGIIRAGTGLSCGPTAGSGGWPDAPHFPAGRRRRHERGGLNRQRVVFTPQEAARLPQDRPYAAYICHYDWAEGEHATLMHCHERLGGGVADPEGQRPVHRRSPPVRGGSRRCGAVQRRRLHDEFPQADQPYQTLCVAIGNLALADLPPYSCFPRTAAPCFTSRSSLRT